MAGESEQLDVVASQPVVVAADGTREKFNKFFAILSTVLGIVCLGLGIWARVDKWDEKVGYLVVATWVICPPIFFWCDWVFFASKQNGLNREVVKQTYDLSRNIWAALTLILVALFGITWPK